MMNDQADNTPLRQTGLYGWHIGAGAKMAPFAGWQMPISYPSGTIAEHRMVRQSAGIFDVSHMGQFAFSGPLAAESLNRVVTSSIDVLPLGGSTYGLLCRPDGTVVDDVFVYRLAERWLMVVNAANRAKDYAWISGQLPPDGVTLTDESDATSMFALQGPRAIEIADELFAGQVGRIPRFGSSELSNDNITALLGRTGYTGEDGVELFVASAEAVGLWTMILRTAQDLDIECGPIGLAARDSLRFEPGFALYGHEIDDTTTPVEARLMWACDMGKEFIGRVAIERQRAEGIEKKLATIQLTERGVPRQGNRVFFDGEPAGTVVSGMYSPTLDGYFANVFVPPGVAKVGTNIEIEIRERRKAAIVAKRPLYTPRYRD